MRLTVSSCQRVVKRSPLAPGGGSRCFRVFHGPYENRAHFPVHAPAAADVVLVLADDMGWNQVGYHGSKFYETPNIDRVAREGIKFSPCLQCGPHLLTDSCGFDDGQESSAAPPYRLHPWQAAGIRNSSTERTLTDNKT
jgi:hypothetical protein